MPLKPFNRLKTRSLADVESGNSGNLLGAGIFRVNGEGIIEDNDYGKFLLNPSSWEESKTANWTQNSIPGQSDPILQWVSSGPRTVSFDALVTADTSDLRSAMDSKPNKSNTAQNIVSKIASTFFNVTLPTPRKDANTAESDDIKGRLDISSYLNYYRSLLYPVYDNDRNPSRLRRSPSLVVLYIGRSIPQVPYGLPTVSKVGSNHDLWVVTNLRIRITKQLPNLAPLEASVSFQLMQYTIKSFSRGRFLTNSPKDNNKSSLVDTPNNSVTKYNRFS